MKLSMPSGALFNSALDSCPFFGSLKKMKATIISIIPRIVVGQKALSSLFCLIFHKNLRDRVKFSVYEKTEVLCGLAGVSLPEK